MNNILKMRESLKLSQVEFADAINRTQSTVSRWENGKTVPDVNDAITLLDLAKARGYPLRLADLSYAWDVV